MASIIHFPSQINDGRTICVDEYCFKTHNKLFERHIIRPYTSRDEHARITNRQIISPWGKQFVILGCFLLKLEKEQPKISIDLVAQKEKWLIFDAVNDRLNTAGIIELFKIMASLKLDVDEKTFVIRTYHKVLLWFVAHKE